MSQAVGSGGGTKSPSAPSKSLAVCWEAFEKLYRAFPHAAFDRTEAAHCLSMSSTSGSFKGLFSDLKQYGLLEETTSGDHVATELAKELTLCSESDEGRIRYQLATSPAVFERVLKDQGNHLPDTAMLANVLVGKYGFNRKKAAETAKALWSSLEWAGSIDAKGNVAAPRLADGTEAERAEEPVSEEVGAELSEDGAPGLPPGETGVAGGLMPVAVPLAGGREARVMYPKDMTKEDAERIGAVLMALAF